ncbi:hypothetical protein GCM10009079_03560 [Ralstonia mannitolilytica]
MCRAMRERLRRVHRDTAIAARGHRHDQLTHTRQSVGEIGARVGYQSEAAFNKAFQQQLGMTPARYRRATH